MRHAQLACLLLVLGLGSCSSAPPASSGPADAPIARASEPRPSWLEENPTGSGVAPTGHRADEVVAVVRGESLTLQQLVDNSLEWWGDKTLEELIFRTLMEQDRKRAGVEVTADEVSRRADALLAALEKQVVASAPGTTLVAFLAERGETPEGYRGKLIGDENFRRQLLLEKLIRYDQLVQEKVEVQQIQVGTAEAAKEILDRLSKQADFGRVAEDESEDVRSAQRGGRVDPFVWGMSPYGVEFDRAAFALAPGQLSPVVANAKRGTYHLIRCVSKTPRRETTYEQVRDDVWKSILENPPNENEMGRWITRMRELAREQVEVRWNYGVEK